MLVAHIMIKISIATLGAQIRGFAILTHVLILYHSAGGLPFLSLCVLCTKADICNQLRGRFCALDLVAKFRPDLTWKFAHLYNDNTVANYIYHCNAQDPRLVECK